MLTDQQRQCAIMWQPQPRLTGRVISFRSIVAMDGTLHEADVCPAAFWRYNRLVDERNLTKVWSDPRAHTTIGPNAAARPR